MDEYKTSPDRTRDTGAMDFYAFYLQDEVDLMDGRLYLLGGLRYDYAKLYDGSYHSTLASYSSLESKAKVYFGI